MNHKKKMLFLLSLAVLSIVQTQAAYAVDLSEFPSRLGDALGMNDLAGQMLASSLVFALFLFPTMLLTSKRKNQDIAVIIMAFLVSVVLVAFQWLPYWVLFFEFFIIAFLYAAKVKGFITGD